MKLLAIALLAIASCSGPEPTAAPAPSTRAAPTAVVERDAGVPALIGPEVRQVITAIAADWPATTVELRLWQRDGARWQLALGPWPAVIGGAGAAWGIGLHGAGAPDGDGGPVKQEGDGRSPAGVFAVRNAYGYARRAPAGVRLAYAPVDEHWKCVDDPRSGHYTRILDARTTEVDWKSAEDMRRRDELYRWVIDVAHNPAATPGAGSCIFLHVWRGPASPTIGCTALDERKLSELLERLDARARYVLLPRAPYEAVAARWGLPPTQ